MNRFITPAFNRTLLVCFLAFFSETKIAKGTHSMGADLTYQCMGGNTYKLTLSFYRDCVGIAAPTSVYIDVTSASCGYSLTATGYPITGTGQEITPICPSETSTCNGGTFTGIQEWIYEAVITLPAQCVDWTFSYSLCCRNGAITTINAPLSEDIYVYSMLNNTISPCNNSPTFSNKPVPFVCLGQQFCFNHGANDPDGDSLVYSLITPLSISGFPVTYISPYSATQPLNSVPPMSFDSQSGDFCITPQSLEVTVMAVLVSEYRNGVLIGKVERDLQITVISCNNMIPTLTGINGTNEFTATVCQGELLCFAMYSDDQDPGQTVSMTWNQGIPGGSFNAVGTPHPFGTFCWTPGPATVLSNPHCFTVQIQDDACPYYGSQIYSYCITVIDLVANAGPDQVVNCGSTVNITASATGSQGPLTYLWSNGFTGASQQVGPGTYTVTITDGMCSDEDSVVVTPLAGPSAQFNFQAGCINDPVLFTDLSSTTGGTGITGWAWDFGDGGTSSQQNPSHFYSSPGTYNACLVVTTTNGCTDTICQSISILASTTASFNAVNACVNSPVTFNNTSSPSGLNFNWDFGNGTTSNQISPVTTFNTPGTYDVTLIAGSGSGCPDTITSTITIYAQPVAAFSFTGSSACQGGTISFNDNSTGNITSWNWQFDNGSSSQQQHPATTYGSPGTYNVTLIVQSIEGCIDTLTQPVVITPGLTASVNTPAPVCSGQSVTLTAAGGTQFEWSNGASTASITVSPLSTTTYTVTVSDINGCSDTAQVMVTVNNNLVVSITADTNICEGETTLLSATGGMAFTWNTGDTLSSISVSPLVTTTYSVSSIDANGCLGDTTITIYVFPLPSINIPPAFLCTGNTITLDAGNPGAAFLWNNGITTQTFLVSTPGTYTVTVTSPAGCSSTQSVAVTAGGTASVTNQHSMCTATSLTLNAGNPGSTYLWSPGGSTSQSITVSDSGQYIVVVTDVNGCTGTIIYNVNELPLPQPAFSWIPSCSGLFSFNNNSTITTGAITGWNWNFGSGNTSILENPSFTFSSPGTYPVNLTVTSDSGCIGSITSQVTFSTTGMFIDNLPDSAICDNQTLILDAGNPGYNYLWSTGDSTQTITVGNSGVYSVTITDVSGCSAIFNTTIQVYDSPVSTYSVMDVCEGDSCYFINNTSVPGGVLSYQWTFGDGNTSSINTPVHLYAGSGTYNTQLVATSGQGCTDTFQVTVMVNENPQIQFTASGSCLNDSVIFNPQGIAGSGSIASWMWNFGDGTIGSIPDPKHMYNSPGSYLVQVTLENSNGCSAVYQDSVNIYPVPDPQISFNAGCLNEPVTFIIADTSGLTNLLWNFGDGTFSSVAFPVHFYNSFNNYYVTLLAANQFGCLASDSLLVAPAPLPVAAFNAGTACEGTAISFMNTSAVTSGNLSYTWNFGDNANTSMSVHPVHIYNRPGSYQVQLIAITNSGCADTVSLPVTVYANPEPAFEPLEAEGCGPLPIQFNDLSIPGSGTLNSWNWNFGDGTSAVDQHPFHTYETDGSFSVTLTVTNSFGCTSTLTLPSVITVHPSPIAVFTADPPLTNILEPVYFINQSTGAVQYSWLFGDGTSSTEVNPHHIYSDSGHYTVTLLAVNEFNCVAHYEYPVQLLPTWTAYIPNVFSPNADGLNELFHIYGIGILAFEMEIWDRWGELIYVGNQGWDGSVINSSEPAKQDVYIYKVAFTTVLGDKKDLIGRVTLVR